MSSTSSNKTEVVPPFVSANLIQTRLVDERITSAPVQSSTEPKPVQLKAETTTTFAVALDNPKTPSRVLIELEYLVTLRIDESDFVIADYKAKHASEFKIISWHGFEDWTQVPQSSLVPYFAMSHNVALRRAQRTLLDMGFGTVVLPVLTEFIPSSSASTAEV